MRGNNSWKVKTLLVRLWVCISVQPLNELANLSSFVAVIAWDWIYVHADQVESMECARTCEHSIHACTLW